MLARRSLTVVPGATMRNSSGPYRPISHADRASRLTAWATTRSACSAVACPWTSLRSRKLSMSATAIASGSPLRRDPSTRPATSSKIAPWLSSPVEGSRRDRSRRIRACRFRRPCDARKMSHRRGTRTTAAESMAIATSRRTASAYEASAVPSRSIATTALVRPPSTSGRYSETTWVGPDDVPESTSAALGAPLSAERNRSSRDGAMDPPSEANSIRPSVARIRRWRTPARRTASASFASIVAARPGVTGPVRSGCSSVESRSVRTNA